MGHIKLRDDLIFEVVGDQLMVCDPKAGVVHKLSGRVASAVSSLQTDSTTTIDAEIASQLVVAGIAVASDASTTRRRVLLGGAALAGGGLATVLLPSATAAASGLGDGDDGSGGNGGSGGDGDPLEDEGLGGSGGNGGNGGAASP
jgi:hypothetical protein